MPRRNSRDGSNHEGATGLLKKANKAGLGRNPRKYGEPGRNTTDVRGLTGSHLAIGPEDVVHTLDSRAPLAHRGSATFHRTGTHIARGKDAWPTRLKRPRRTILAFPGRGIGDCMAGFDEALGITLDFRR